MSYPAIEFLNVHKYYGKIHALRGLNLAVQPGEVFGFLGPNGAGKTTTIRCLLGFDPAGQRLDPGFRPGPAASPSEC